MAASSDPGEQAVADRLAQLMRSEQGHSPGSPGQPGQYGPYGQPSQPAMSLLRAARAEAEVVTPPEPQRPWATKRSNVKKLANPKPHGRPGLIRRPAWSDEPEDVDHVAADPAVDPRHLPPPVVRKGFHVAGSVPDVHTPSEVFAGQIRQKKFARDRRNNTPDEAHSQFGKPSASQILDMRVPGSFKGDSPFLVPLMPSMLLAAASTYLWFQASIRLTSHLPLAPILIGVAVGGIMRLGTRSVDFARVIFAVILTAFATFWGHAATKDFGPLGELTAAKIRWSDLPRVANPAGLISTFHATAEKSLGSATLMFAGMIAAGLLSSMTAK